MQKTPKTLSANKNKDGQVFLPHCAIMYFVGVFPVTATIFAVNIYWPVHFFLREMHRASWLLFNICRMLFKTP